MSQYPAPTCPFDIDEETLSAWHDGLLDEREAQRLAGHVDTCAACQSRLASFQALGQALRQQWTPNLQARVWRGLRHAMEGDNMTGRDRARWGTTAAVVAAVLVVALFAGILLRRAGQNSLPGGNTTLTPTPTATARVTPSPTAAQGEYAGWKGAQGIGQGNLGKLALAPSDPNTAYSCVITAGQELLVSVTHDGGQTWHQLGTPLQGQFCIITVNPTNPNDVVVNDGNSFSIHMVRSHDGGAHWQPQQIGNLAFQTEGWVGSSLYVATVLTESGTGLTNISVSTNGGPFTRVDSDGKLAGMTLADLGTPRFITGTGGTIALQFGQMTPPIGGTTLVSHDGGTTWKAENYLDGARQVHLFTASPDQTTLVGIYDDAQTQPTLSHDGGATWQALPAAPGNVPNFNDVWMTPDGTLCATSSNLGKVDGDDHNLYLLRPGATSWSVALRMPMNAFPLAVSWDTSGRPAAIWASDSTDGAGSILMSHAL